MSSLVRKPLAYADPAYAASLIEFGTPRALTGCKGWILERPVPGTEGLRDGTGCYPLFSCQDWSQLSDDINELADDLLTVSLVADPFGASDATELAHSFDVVRPFKEHYVTELHRPVDVVASAHHRKYARRALRNLVIEQCARPLQYLDEWVELYAGLSAAHRLSGLRAFSRQAFEQQLAMEGLVMFRASRDGRTAGIHLWLQSGDVAYGHLGATNDLGYALAAAYGLYWHAIEWFSGSVQWLHLGGSAGARGTAADGLAAFKIGWATATRTAYWCARCFDRETYDALVRAKDIDAGGFFPAYRAGEA
jgi:hypothetical protein